MMVFMDKGKKEFIYKVKIYYEDTDAGGIVYYANYLKFFERARTELIYALGFNHKNLKEKDAQIIVRKFSITYKKPAFLEDELIVKTCVEEIKGARIVMSQTAFKNDDVVTEATVELACVDQSGKPKQVPEELKKSIEKLLN